MSNENDMLRRGDVRSFLTNALDHALAQRGVQGSRDVTDWVLAAVIPEIPADPVANAEKACAAAADSWEADILVEPRDPDGDCISCCFHSHHADDCFFVTLRRRIDDYRAAVQK